MRTHSDIVSSAGSLEEVAQQRGVSLHTVRSWIARNSIPPEHWLAFVEAKYATLDELAQHAANNPRQRKAPTDTARAA